MTATSIVHSDSHTHVCCTIGALRHVTPHTGQDHIRQVHLYFDYARLEIPSAALAELIRRSQEALVAQHYGESYTDCSGAAADLGDAS
jgi:hypothetical protein